MATSVSPCKDCILNMTKTISIQHPLLSDLEKCKLDHNRIERTKKIPVFSTVGATVMMSHQKAAIFMHLGPL